MDRQKGFIATSLLYSFFLVFVTLFIGMVTIYLQNRVYLTKFEDSSKNAIYIREMKEIVKKGSTLYIEFNDDPSKSCKSYENNIFNCGEQEMNLANCETIYNYNKNYFHVEGCS